MTFTSAHNGTERRSGKEKLKKKIDNPSFLWRHMDDFWHNFGFVKNIIWEWNIFRLYLDVPQDLEDALRPLLAPPPATSIQSKLSSTLQYLVNLFFYIF